jgi:hypothetical protein
MNFDNIDRQLFLVQNARNRGCLRPTLDTDKFAAELWANAMSDWDLRRYLEKSIFCSSHSSFFGNLLLPEVHQ